MDMNNKYYQPSMNKKITALKATAAAVIALNAGMASAAPCPLVISSSMPSVCSFTTNSSVTVANGGTIQGIDMSSYQPTPSSFITVDPSGLITGANVGISLSTSSLSGSISNSGSIHGNQKGIKIIDGSTVSGGISNSGLISGNGTGIAVSSSTIDGGISNSGSISGGSHGIGVYHGSTINGGIFNSGTISAGTTAGIGLIGSTVNGGISNSGLISASQAGISLANTASVSGGITNSGTINATAPNGQGITAFSSSSITGGISNSGTINATNVSQKGQDIAIYSSSLTGGISNSGALNGFTGIRIDLGAAINGGISNSGSISAQYGGILAFHSSTITGNISNSGNISDASGAAGQYGIAANTNSVVNGSISNSGSINAATAGIGIYGGASVTGSISNSGSINSAGGGITIQTNATVGNGISNSGSISAYTGIEVSNSVITGNISNSGSISAVTGIGVTNNSTVGGISNSGTIQGSAHAISVAANSSVNSIDIIGQTARIIGDVLATGTTVNISSGAVFTSEGEFDVLNFNIASGALFHMANSITASGAVDNSGTLSIATGTLQTITGNYTQETNGIYQIGATNTGNYGQLSVSGLADLSASGAIDVQVQSGFVFHQGDVLSNVLSGGTFTAPTNGYSVTDNSFLWQFIATTNGSNGVDLSIGIDPVANDVCKGKYCEGAATTIIGQVAAGNAGFSPYASLPTATAFATAASQATPELTNENLQVTQLVSRTVIDVLPMWSTLRGASTGDAMLYQPGKVWLKPYGASMSQNQRNTVNGYTASVYGLVAGGDVQVANNWMLGGALAAGGDNLRGKSVLSGQTIDSAQYQALIYTSKMFANNAYFAAQGLLGYGSNDSKRSIPLFASTAKGNYNSWFTDLSAELGWSHALTDRFVFIPAVNASYLFINQGSYTETGSLMDLNVRANNNSSLVVGADANVAYRATTLKNQQDVTLTGHAGVAYDLVNSQPSTISTFVAGGPSFSTYGIQYNGAVFRGGVGLTLANPTKPFSINLNADLQSGNNGNSGIYSATLKYKV